MKVSDIYTNADSWLKVADLAGKKPTVVIETVTLGEFADGKSNITLGFHGVPKKLGLNATNARTLVELYGDDTDNWIGGAITLYSVRTQTPAGAPVDGIRIIPIVPVSPVAARPPVPHLGGTFEPPAVASEDDYGTVNKMPWD